MSTLYNGNNNNVGKSCTTQLPLARRKQYWSPRMISWNSHVHGSNFEPRPNDVILATFPKTGSTWLAYLTHLLRTRAKSLEFILDDVVPWINIARDLGQDLDGKYFECFMPRLYKSHMPLSSINPGCKYVVTIRSPEKTAISFFNFFQRMNRQEVKGKDLTEFIIDGGKLQGDPEKDRPSIWTYYSEFWACRDHPSLLIIPYEDLCEDMINQLILISSHVLDGGIVSTAVQNKIKSCSTKDVMGPLETISTEWCLQQSARIGTCPGNVWDGVLRVCSQPHKVSVIDDRGRTFLQERWNAEMKPHTGFEDYESFLAAVRKLNRTKLAMISRAST
uniref:Sulfotransferase domain-containing protein n=1 Tax=Aplanochytrium stocchinoi TaxID=215587 RepID=A0A7S3PP25_9STRA|mmetsp:Transcript_12423/g.15410  ORF Transcript_12423/g.15410 Transcript_12423/m.15410 type:complete len:333 (+) Transcript_12423:58-1056(+)